MALPPPRGKQRNVLALKPEGHVVVLGTAGSGKTTVAALRAQILADPGHPQSGPTLLVTYNKSLVAYLRSIAREELANVHVETFHKFARGYLSSRGLMGHDTIVAAGDRLRLIAEAMVLTGIAEKGAGSGLRFNVLREQLLRELGIISEVGLDRQGYINDSDHRNDSLCELLGAELVYDTLITYRMVRDVDGPRFDFDDMLTAAYAEMIADDGERRYKHIVIDEGQDFAPVMLKTLIAAVPVDGSITFFGDVAQQIYGRETNWREAGFRVSKVEVFDENLRNTREIARLGLAISSMPYYTGVADMIAPTIPADAGPLPTLVQYPNFDVELATVCQQAQNAVLTQNVSIICPTNVLADVVMKMLEERGERRVERLTREIGNWPRTPRIFVATYHNAKGLEFGAVILPFLSADFLPSPWTVEILGEAAGASAAGSLLYVGVTRCRRNLLLTYSGEISPLLPNDDGLTQKLYQRPRGSAA
jgi:superfamily I DNA/RNA helicase